MTRPKPAPKHRCYARRKDGKPCDATPMVNPRKIKGKLRFVCLFHFGQNAQTLGAKGGRHGAQRGPESITQFDPPRSPEELVPILSATIAEIRAGSIDPKTVSALTSCSGQFMEAIKVASLDKRVTALEKKFLAQRGDAATASVRPRDFGPGEEAN